MGVPPDSVIEPDAAISVTPDSAPVTLAEPLKFWPQIVRVLASVVAVSALPVNAPTKLVDVTELRPARVVAVEPNEMLVEPIVTELLVNEPLPMLVSVFVAPLIVLPVRT